MVTAFVLVIDGYAGFREAMEYCLSKAGIAALSAESVAQALPRVKERVIDVVVLDATVSFEAALVECRAIKGRPEFAEAWVVLLAARVTDEWVEEARNAGARAVLPRLFDWADLMTWVERAVAAKDSRGERAP